jgi:hypothetical protein
MFALAESAVSATVPGRRPRHHATSRQEFLRFAKKSRYAVCAALRKVGAPSSALANRYFPNQNNGPFLMVHKWLCHEDLEIRSGYRIQSTLLDAAGGST